MKSVVFILVLLSALPVLAAPIDSVASLNAFLSGPPSEEKSFRLEGVVTFVPAGDERNPVRYFVLSDGSGHMEFWLRHGTPPATGEVIRLAGTAYVTPQGRPWVVPDVKNIVKLGNRPVPPPPMIRVSEIDERKQAYETVCVRGTAIEIVRDEIDPQIEFILLKDGATTLPVAILRGQVAEPQTLLDAEISVTGIYRRSVSGKRTFSGPFVDALASTGLGTVRILRPPPADAFDWPELEPTTTLTPREIARMGKRSAEGTVLAGWQGNRLILRTAQDRLIGVTLVRPIDLPAAGSHVRVAGYPVTDLYRINLDKARVKVLDGTTPAEGTPKRVAASDMLTDRLGRACIDPDCHGQLLSIVGEVEKLPTTSGEPLLLKCDDTIFSVLLPSSESDGHNRLERGCRIEVTGTCIIEASAWHPYLVFPQIKDIRFVVRRWKDIRILARPPWWTPVRLFAVIAGLFLVIIVFVVWVRILNRLVARRGRELFDSRIAETAASLKVEERTRLAAELHDALSQNLSAVACQVAAAKSTAAESAETQSLLTTAERMLQSSRTELTRCLWDLRGDALEESDFTRAIENTLRCLSMKADVRVRFNVPRTRVDDSTAHAILCIVRELVTNAVRHGRATEILVAGETHETTLSFSVRDNGTGFDTATRKGLAEGHFGLEGIRDRANRLNGTFDLSSAPGCGTKAVVSLSLKNESTGTEFNA